MKCWKATILTSVSCCPAKTWHYRTTSPSGLFRDQRGPMSQQRRGLTLLALHYDLCSQDSCFCLHYSWNNTIYIPSRAKGATTGRHHLCFLSHDGKLTSTLNKDELHYFPKKSVLTVSSLR